LTAGSAAGLQHVQSLDDHDVGLPNGLILPRHDVVPEMGVHRREHLGHTGLHIRQKANETTLIVALWKALALKKTARFECRERQQEAIGRNQIDRRVAWPA